MMIMRVKFRKTLRDALTHTNSMGIFVIFTFLEFFIQDILNL
jgi:hypothetical protein